jgi:hypothetical protein
LHYHPAPLQMWHLQERKKVNDFYSALAKKNAALAQ